MSVFHGDWNEDPKEFLDSYLQCTATTDDNFKAQHFINYLGADSDAEEWFDELRQDEKKDWVVIELLFRRKWLKEEVSTKETVTSRNELQPASTHLTPSITSTGTPPSISLMSSQHVESPEMSTTPEATKIDFIAPKMNIFAQNHSISHQNILRPSLQLPDTRYSLTSSKRTAFIDLHTQMVDFNTPLFASSHTQADISTAHIGETNTHTRPDYPLELPKRPPRSVEEWNEPQEQAGSSLSEYYLLNPSSHPSSPQFALKHPFSLPTPSNVSTSLPAAPSNPASSIKPKTINTLQALQPTAQAVIGHEKSALLRAVFESQPPMESLSPTTITTAFKTRSATASFTQKQQKMRKSTNFNQNYRKLLISSCFKGADSTESLLAPSIAPTKHPCDIWPLFSSILDLNLAVRQCHLSPFSGLVAHSILNYY
jgi:hypothetical protein